MDFLPRLIIALIMFGIGLYLAKLLSKIVRRALEKRNVKLQIIQLISRITFWSVVVLVTTVAMSTVGINLSAFLTSLGIIGFTIGFALQDVSKNFVAGLLLLISQPFQIGDIIHVGGYMGTVQTIELRATELKTVDGRQVLIPNADVFSSPLTNFTRNRLRRVEIKCGVAYGTDLQKARQVSLEAVRSIPGVLEDPAPSVNYNEFGDFAINFSVFYWVDAIDLNFQDMSDMGIVVLERAFAQSGIEIPFPIGSRNLLNPASDQTAAGSQPADN
jgi:small conductance mechanosensitive channel